MGKESKEFFDIIIIVPLEFEFKELEKEFEVEDDRSTDLQVRHVLKSKIPEIRILAVLQEEMGRSSAGKTASQILSEYETTILVCLGIAGSLSKDVKLGHVCYTGTVLDIYDNAKVSETEQGEQITEFSPTRHETYRQLTAALNFQRTQPYLAEGFTRWQADRQSVAESVLVGDVMGRNGVYEKITKPEVHNGAIVCGPVSNSEKYNKKLRDLDRKVLAIETESGGICHAIDDAVVKFIAIRGISDYADRGKGKLEDDTVGAVRKIAAGNAVSFFKLQFRNQNFLKILSSGKDSAQIPLPVVRREIAVNPVADALKLLSEEVNSKLREVSPEFRLHPRGYRLPLPRVRKEEPDSYNGTSLSEPIEIVEAIQKDRYLAINVPRTYPDQSLGWIVADDLLSEVIDNKQAIPIVIDGNSVRPPSADFQAQSTIVLQEINREPGAVLVFIVNDIPFKSKTRVEYIVEQTNSYPDSRVVFLVHDDSNLIQENEFISTLPLALYQLCQISFREIADFVQKNFSMTGTESEVIALRLRETFNRFELSAHPTYFAGIPRETLSALLQANRRAELIQLAVDGFLTFLVADDTADVTLSRTTRSRFLRSLVLEIRLERRSFAEGDLIKFAEAFAKKFDFAVKPMPFIQAFIDKGILHFEDDKVKFSLPFIESYLLASELSLSPDKAALYFDFMEAGFDNLTFDLYAEIGPSADLVDRISAELLRQNALVTQLQIGDGSDHILLSEKLNPADFTNPVRLSSLRDSLRQASRDVLQGKGDVKRKQSLLDISDRVHEFAAKERRKRAKADDAQGKGDRVSLNYALRSWYSALILLGSGAERLDAEKKREIGSRLVMLASSIIDKWTRYQNNIDFDSIRDKLLGDVTVLEKIKERFDLKDDNEVRRMLNGFMDLIQYASVATPIRRMLSLLCEHARHKVLATSVENSKVLGGTVEHVLHATWLLDIDSERGKKLIKDAIKKIPRSPFFRINLVAHYLSRTYWNHWNREDRLLLLDAAERVIKPLRLDIDKAKIIRSIESTDPENDD